MTSRCACSYHQGIDIAAADGTDVYAVRSGVVRIVTPDWVEVDSDGGSAFQYWHIRSAVKVGDHVQARQTSSVRSSAASEHVHLTELQNGKPTNPLAPGHIGPYADSTTPRVNTITFRLRDAGSDLLPEYLHGTVEIVAAAADTPAVPVPGKWNGLPVTPSKLTYHVETFPNGADRDPGDDRDGRQPQSARHQRHVAHLRARNSHEHGADGSAPILVPARRVPLQARRERSTPAV